MIPPWSGAGLPVFRPGQQDEIIGLLFAQLQELPMNRGRKAKVCSGDEKGITSDGRLINDEKKLVDDDLDEGKPMAGEPEHHFPPAGIVNEATGMPRHGRAR